MPPPTGWRVRRPRRPARDDQLAAPPALRSAGPAVTTGTTTGPDVVATARLRHVCGSCAVAASTTRPPTRPSPANQTLAAVRGAGRPTPGRPRRPLHSLPPGCNLRQSCGRPLALPAPPRPAGSPPGAATAHPRTGSCRWPGPRAVPARRDRVHRLAHRPTTARPPRPPAIRPRPGAAKPVVEKAAPKPCSAGRGPDDRNQTAAGGAPFAAQPRTRGETCPTRSPKPVRVDPQPAPPPAPARPGASHRGSSRGSCRGASQGSSFHTPPSRTANPLVRRPQGVRRRRRTHGGKGFIGGDLPADRVCSRRYGVHIAVGCTCCGPPAARTPRSAVGTGRSGHRSGPAGVSSALRAPGAHVQPDRRHRLHQPA